MKNLKKTVKDNKKGLTLFFGGIFVVGVLGQVAFIKSINNKLKD